MTWSWVDLSENSIRKTSNTSPYETSKLDIYHHLEHHYVHYFLFLVLDL